MAKPLVIEVELDVKNLDEVELLNESYKKSIKILKQINNRISFKSLPIAHVRAMLWLEHTKQDIIKTLKELGEI